VRALVTGATGCIGSHLVERLAAGGTEVRALVRRSSDTSQIAELGIELAYGDLRDAASLGLATKGVDVVYHTAAVVGDWGPARDFAAVDAVGTAQLADAAVHNGVPRFVHLSSVAVYGLLRVRKRHVPDDFPVDPRPARWDDYARAKIAGENALRHHHAQGRIALTVLRPTLVYGPRDRVVLPRLARLLAERRQVRVGSGRNRVHVVFADDVAMATELAGSRDVAVGRTYNVDGPRDVEQRDFLDGFADLLGAPRPTLRLPLAVAYPLAIGCEGWGRFRRHEEAPPLTRTMVAACGGEAFYDTTRARDELGWAPKVLFPEGLERTRRWLRERG